jgi:hypothetical protein
LKEKVKAYPEKGVDYDSWKGLELTAQKGEG